MIPFSRRAEQHVDQLITYFEERDRFEAVSSLHAALREASDLVERDPDAGLPAPRPYPQLARPGRRWMKVGRYWVAYRLKPRLVITGVFYDAADIPGRI